MTYYAIITWRTEPGFFLGGHLYYARLIFESWYYKSRHCGITTIWMKVNDKSNKDLEKMVEYNVSKYEVHLNQSKSKSHVYYSYKNVMQSVYSGLQPGRLKIMTHQQRYDTCPSGWCSWLTYWEQYCQSVYYWIDRFGRHRNGR